MTVQHPVTPGFYAACEYPEAVVHVCYAGARLHGCRPCLSALVALAVNRPATGMRRVAEHPERHNAVTAALLVVRELLDEFDPLRVRAEQELLPLVGAS